MSKKSLYTQDNLRAELEAKLTNAKLQGRKQREIAEEIGIKQNHLSGVLAGLPINGAVLAWLGYEKAEALYRRVK